MKRRKNLFIYDWAAIKNIVMLQLNKSKLKVNFIAEMLNVIAENEEMLTDDGNTPTSYSNMKCVKLYDIELIKSTSAVQK